jgi:hypothetical protein
MPLKSAAGPSCWMMYCITSVKLLKGLPFLAGGGFDCSPTLATIRGWVAIVASILDMEPRTASCQYLDDAFSRAAGLTERFPRLQGLLSGVHGIPQSLVGTVCDGWVDYKYQAGSQAPPKASPAVFALNDVHGRREHALALVLAHGLLARGDDGDRDSEELGERSSNGAQRQLNRGARGCLQGPSRHVDGADYGIPVEVCEVCRRDSQK